MIFCCSTEQNVPIRLAGTFLLLCWKPVRALLLPFIFLGGKLFYILLEKMETTFHPQPWTPGSETQMWTNAIKISLSPCPYLHVCSQPRGAGFPPGYQCPEGGKLRVNCWKSSVSSSTWQLCSEVKDLLLLPAKRAQMFFNLHRRACRRQVSTVMLHVWEGPLLLQVPGIKYTLWNRRSECWSDLRAFALTQGFWRGLRVCCVSGF